MRKMLILLLTVLVILFSKSLYSQNKLIVADHSVVDKYLDIPQQYIDVVKTMLLCYPGESHSRGLMYGLNDLELMDDRFAVNVKWTGGPEETTSEYLRAWKSFRNLANTNWTSSGGEEDFFTSDEAVNMMLNHLDYCSNTLDNPVSAFGFGWCWDMTATAGPDDNGWAGRLYWPVDKSNFTDNWDTTSTAPCMQHYINAVNNYNTSYPVSHTFFSTGPVDGGDNTRAKGYQRWLKNEFIRKSANKAVGTSYLFDYADIICWNDDGEQNTVTYDNHEYIYIHPDNEGNYDGGNGGCHISQAGCLRLAKAMWWLLAKMAGWDNSSASSIRLVGKGLLPDEYLLEQNYPNPFNPTTMITYQIPKEGMVKINIFNVLGQKIATLVSARQPAGKYQVKWEATGYAGGVYLYQIQTDEYSAIKKMILLN
jgi:hypothetical protein